MVLSESEGPEFFTLMAAFDAFANRRLRCVPGLDDPLEMRDADPVDRFEIRQAGYADRALLEDFARTGPAELPDGLAADARRLVHAVRGRFFVERVLKRHAIFLSMTDPAVVYAVEGLTDPIDAVLDRNGSGVPAMVDVVLLPWRGRIVWDGLVSVLRIRVGSGIRGSLRTTYTKAKERGTIVTTLGESAPAKPKRARPDQRPAVDALLAAAEALGKADTGVQNAALALVRQSARLARVALDDDRDAMIEAVRQVNQGLRRVIRVLED